MLEATRPISSREKEAPDPRWALHWHVALSSQC
jgi:hypothetical protein